MNILKFKGLYLTFTLGLIILYLSLQPPSEADIKHLVSDKVVHLIAYFILVFLFRWKGYFLNYQFFWLLWLMEDVLSCFSHLWDEKQI